MRKGNENGLDVGGDRNPVTMFKNWLSKNPSVGEVALVTVTNAAEGAMFSVLLNTWFNTLNSALTVPPPPIPYLKRISGGRVKEARKFAVYCGVNAGITCMVKKIRGKDDLHTSMVAGFGAGVLVSIVTGKPTDAIAFGVMLALYNGACFKEII